MGRTVTPLSFDFAGSNPALPTVKNYAGVAQLVERQPSKLNVAGSNPVSRSKVKPKSHLQSRVRFLLYLSVSKMTDKAGGARRPNPHKPM